tara:strand:- start:875 stop:1300 length:426 start_codon:yes stop_codon:yes gene_type:complete
MREINKIVVHCSATQEGKNISAATIDKWHKKRGWRGIGYHYVIALDGSMEYGRPVEQIGAHVKKMNKNSIGIVYIGGVEAERGPDGDWVAKDTRTPEQKETLILLLKVLKKLHPEATIHGHNEFAAKSCPCFDAHAEYCDL